MNQLQELADQFLFELFSEHPAEWMKENGLSQGHLESPEALFKVALDNAPFGIKKMTRLLQESQQKEPNNLLSYLMDRVANDPTKQQRLGTFIDELLNSISKNECDALITKAFSLGLTTYYPILLNAHRFHPSKETWAQIWPKIIEHPPALSKVLSGFPLYEPRPPIFMDLLYNQQSGKLHESTHMVASHLLNDDPNLSADLWKLFMKSYAHLPESEADMVSFLIMKGSAAALLGQADIIANLIELLRDEKISARSSFRDLLEKISSLPNDALAKLSITPEYPELVKLAFSTLLTSNNPAAHCHLAQFLARAPWLEPIYLANKEGVAKLHGEAKVSALRDPLQSLLERFSPSG